ncbi:glycosyltransferase [Nodularia harveyana UHCC-0300]|uniref:Glycosyltransferase n=1 Tax=Nodularia harveyana UHCC-0300 TaxID=2974287 RepID=A0ABU5UFS4_9CYAN|nr:glycosyltransferase [Nodularia harveyana]MEA5582350.1 glycosyltransferase [Nodularia harveyana UHCC-0300]
MIQPIDATTAKSFLPMVSVVVPIYNGEIDVPDLINCLRSQTYPQDRVEYLLVDNNSSDRTLTLLQESAENYPIIHVLSENHIQSSYAARNTGIRAAIGEIVAFTDADCHPQPQWLHSLIQPFSDPDVMIVAGEIAALMGKTILEQHAERQETLSQKHTLSNSFCPYGQTANLAIRRLALETAGLFRPYLTTGGDADICWRILRSNIGRLEFAPDAIIQHRHRATLQELASQWRRYGRSNRYLHQLHGVQLMREMTAQDYSYRLARWLLKEIPRDILQAIAGQASIVDLLNTPISLFTARARAVGQRQAELPENAQNIDWL